LNKKKQIKNRGDDALFEGSSVGDVPRGGERPKTKKTKKQKKLKIKI
jgi:hypothetical protein